MKDEATNTQKQEPSAADLLRRIYKNFNLYGRTPGKWEVFNSHATYQREIAPLVKAFLKEK